MSTLTSAVERVRVLASAKLGRCTYCIRWSGKGTILGWALVAATILVWPQPIALGLAVAVAGAFSLLMLMHVGTFSVRIARGHARRVASPGRSLDRRAFLRVGARAAGGALILALTGSARSAFGLPVGGPCEDTVRQRIQGSGKNPGVCFNKLRARVDCTLDVCFNRACPDSGTICLPRGQSRVRNFEWFTFPDSTGKLVTTCSGDVVCLCHCRPRPNLPD
jgi:hypothetical protein